MNLSYAVTPQLLSKFSRMKLVLTQDVVHQFRLANGQQGKRDKMPERNVKSVDGKPDIKVSDSNGMTPMIILKPVDDVHLQDNVPEISLKKSQAASRSVANKMKLTKTATNNKKTKQVDSKKASKLKRKSFKRNRPQFVLPAASRYKKHHEKE